MLPCSSVILQLISTSEKNLAKIHGGAIILRAAYATGSGVSSIGLDPRKATIENIFPDLAELMNKVRVRTQKHYATSGQTAPTSDFNQVSVKIYFNGKETGEHTDIGYEHGHLTAQKNNSQLPGTPVVILTSGSNKILEFVRYGQFDKPKKSTKYKSLKVQQKHGSFFLLDPRDEALDHDHCFWKHKSFLSDTAHGVCMSLMFRVVTSKAAVYSHNSCLVNPLYYMPGWHSHHNPGKKIKQFDAAWKSITDKHTGLLTTVHQKNRDYIVTILRDTLRGHFKLHKPYSS